MARKDTQHRSSAAPGDPGGSRYLALTGHERRIDRRVVNREEKASLAKDGFDFHYDRASGDMSIKLASGRVRDFHGNCPLGPETYPLLEKILTAGSDFVPLVSENWQYALVSRLRALFEDPPGHDHFFEVRRQPDYAIRLKPEIKWRIITVLQSDDS